MNTYRVFFIKEKTEVTVKEGTTVLEAERIAGLSPDAPCGGAGKCGKCMVKINGAVEKACQTKITTDIEVEAIEKKSEHRILVKGTERAVTFHRNWKFWILRSRHVQWEKTVQTGQDFAKR